MNLFAGATPRLWHGCGRTNRTTSAHHTNTRTHEHTTYRRDQSDVALEGRHQEGRGGRGNTGACAQITHRVTSALTEQCNTRHTVFCLRILSHNDPQVYRYDLFKYSATHM